MDKDSVREFKIGDNVRFAITGTSAIVLDIERFRAPGQIRILYKIKLSDRTVRVAKPNELEPFEESHSST